MIDVIIGRVRLRWHSSRIALRFIRATFLGFPGRRAKQAQSKKKGRNNVLGPSAVYSKFGSTKAKSPQHFYWGLF
jgi:hypothetical protein